MSKKIKIPRGYRLIRPNEKPSLKKGDKYFDPQVKVFWGTSQESTLTVSESVGDHVSYYIRRKTK